METNLTIRLPPDVQAENLPSDTVDYSHIEELCTFENQLESKVAPALKEENVHSKGHFSTMNVSTSRSVVNNRTGAGLAKLAEL